MGPAAVVRHRLPHNTERYIHALRAVALFLVVALEALLQDPLVILGEPDPASAEEGLGRVGRAWEQEEQRDTDEDGKYALDWFVTLPSVPWVLISN